MNYELIDTYKICGDTYLTVLATSDTCNMLRSCGTKMCDGIFDRCWSSGCYDAFATNSVRMVTYSNVQVVIEQEETASCRLYLVADTRTSEHKNTQ